MLAVTLTDDLRRDPRAFAGWCLAAGLFQPEEFSLEGVDEDVRLAVIAERDALRELTGHLGTTPAWPLPSVDGVLERLAFVNPDAPWADHITWRLDGYASALTTATHHGLVFALVEGLQARLRAVQAAANMLSEATADLEACAESGERIARDVAGAA